MLKYHFIHNIIPLFLILKLKCVIIWCSNRILWNKQWNFYEKWLINKMLFVPYHNVPSTLNRKSSNNGKQMYYVGALHKTLVYGKKRIFCQFIVIQMNKKFWYPIIWNTKHQFFSSAGLHLFAWYMIRVRAVESRKVHINIWV